MLEQPFRTFANVTLDKVEGGAFSYVGPGTVLHWVTLGRYCSIGDGVTILSKHPTGALCTSPFPYHRLFPAPFDAAPTEHFDELAPTRIGHDVWIGAGVKIKCGVEIGDGAIIGAGSLVTRNVPAFSIYGGVPARLIRPRFDAKLVEQIVALQWWRYNLIGEALPWQRIEEVCGVLAERIASGSLAPYQSERFSVFREDSLIKCWVDKPTAT